MQNKCVLIKSDHTQSINYPHHRRRVYKTGVSFDFSAHDMIWLRPESPVPNKLEVKTGRKNWMQKLNAIAGRTTQTVTPLW